MADPKFKVGDVVHLKSGGPAMTVSSSYVDEKQNSVNVVYWNDETSKFDELKRWNEELFNKKSQGFALPSAL